MNDQTGEYADKPRWLRWLDSLDSLGREVDLDDIDKEYALNILTTRLRRMGRLRCRPEEIRADPLVQKLREIVLHGREPNAEDRRRALQYNIDNVRAGLPFRAPVR